jgi:hypothetical protein
LCRANDLVSPAVLITGCVWVMWNTLWNLQDSFCPQ